MTKITPTELKARRAALGLSQSELAALLPINLRTYQAWEAGRYDPPSLLHRALKSIEQEAPKKKA